MASDWRKKYASVIPDLGTASDREVAKKHGISLTTVWGLRQKVGIPAYGGAHGEREWHSLLGTMPDQTIAERFGISRQRVQQVRKRKGIEAHCQPVDWSWLVPFLGTAPDREVAEKHGVPVHIVLHKRLNLGIPAYSRQSDPEHGRTEYEAVVSAGSIMGAVEQSGLTRSKIQRWAKAYAERHNKRWPIGMSKRVEGAPAEAYRRYMGGQSAQQIAQEMGYKNVKTVRALLRSYANRQGLTLKRKKG